MTSANECSALLAVPYPLRDVDWRARFKAAVVTASLRAADPASFHGPDGFPYLTLKPSGMPPNPVFALVAKFADYRGCALAAQMVSPARLPTVLATRIDSGTAASQTVGGDSRERGEPTTNNSPSHACDLASCTECRICPKGNHFGLLIIRMPLPL